MIYYLYDLFSNGHERFNKKQRNNEATTTKTMVRGERGRGKRIIIENQNLFSARR